MSDISNLFSLARSKLQLSVGGKDKCSLHRWVLLKNSIVQSPSAPPSPSTADSPHPNPFTDDADEDVTIEEGDSFMFPDAGKLVGSTAGPSEAGWLDSLLEQLGDEDEDDFPVESSLSLVHSDEDDDQILFSPTASPLSSTDDLPSQSTYYSPSIVSYSYPYLVPYPPSHPPLIRAYDHHQLGSSLNSLPAPYDDPLPYHDLSESENLSVPDAIEDTSDDESDAPPTPSVGRSASSLALIEASSPSLSVPARPRLQRIVPNVHVDGDDSYFYPFELDPLPFPEHHRTYNIFAEC